jgi:hypothetical protein
MKKAVAGGASTGTYHPLWRIIWFTSSRDYDVKRMDSITVLTR